MQRSRAVGEVAERAHKMGIDPQDLLDFEAGRKRTLEQRLKMGFKTHKPVMDDSPWRTFRTMAEYRRWCNENLEWWLGYGSADHRLRA